MKKNILLFIILISSFSFAQRYKTVSGNLKNLKGISEYNVTFDYSNIEVHGYESEEAYLNEKMDKRKDEEGKSKEFKKEWFDSRTSKYEPAFISYFNNRFSNGEIKLLENNEAKYTMNISTVWIYPGYFMEPSKISVIISVFETNRPSNVLTKVMFEKVIGIEKEHFNNNLSSRITNAYEKLAKNLSIQLKRFL